MKTAIIATLALVVAPAFAAHTRHATHPAPQPPAPPANALSLDQACVLKENGNVGPHFSGHPGSVVAKQLTALNLTKDKFETKDQFAERLDASIARAPLAIAKGHLCAVLYPSMSETKYDPENQQLNLYVAPSYGGAIWLNGDQVVKGVKLTLAETDQKVSEHEGSNAFGVTVTVSDVSLSSIQLALSEPNATDAIKGFGGESHVGLTLPIPMDSNKARELDNEVVTVVEYSVERPYVSTWMNNMDATIDSPLSREDMQTIIHGEIRQIAAVDVKTGTILKMWGP